MAWKKGHDNTTKFPNVIARQTAMVHVGLMVMGIQAEAGDGRMHLFQFVINQLEHPLFFGHLVRTELLLLSGTLQAVAHK